MFGSGKKSSAKPKKEGGITLIAENTIINGDVHFTDQLLINGTIKGNVYADEASGARVSVSDMGIVEGDIKVPHVVVNGTVHGDVYSSEHVQLDMKASVTGDVYYDMIEMVMGAEVNGSLVHQQDKSIIQSNVAEKSTSQAGATRAESVAKAADRKDAKSKQAKPSKQKSASPQSDAGQASAVSKEYEDQGKFKPAASVSNLNNRDGMDANF